ncbi:hypothetical protein D3C80_1870240 [compost metagenome]
MNACVKPLFATSATTFAVSDSDGNHAFSVPGGVPMDSALEYSSCLLCEVLDVLNEHSEQGLSTSMVYLLQHHLKSAKALVDAAASGLMKMEQVGGEQ